MAEDLSISFGGTIDALESALGDVTSAMEAVVTGPLKAMNAAFGELESIGSEAFGALKTAAEDVFSKFEEAGKTVVTSLLSMAKGAGDFTGALGKIVGIVGGGALAAAFTGVAAAIAFANKEMLELVTHAEQYGLSITRLQQLQYAASLTGVGSSEFNNGTQKFVDLLDEAGRKENDLTKLFDANNVKWKDTHGHVVDTSTAMGLVANLVQRAATYSQAVKIAEWAGYSREAVPFLRQGAAAIEDMAKAAPVVDEALARAAANTAKEWNRVVAEWTSWWKTAVIIVTGLLQGLVNVAIGLGKAFGLTVYGIGTKITEEIDGPVKTLNNSVTAFFDNIKNKAKEAAESTDTFTKEFQAAAAHAYAFGQQGPATKLLPEEQKADKDAMRSAREAAEEQLRLADLVFKGKEEKLKEELKVHAITQQQETQQLLAALDVRHSAELAALGKEAAIGGQSAAQHQAIMDKMKTIDQKYANDRQKIMDEARQADVKGWTSTLDQLSGAFNSQLKGLLDGTTTWQKAMKTIFEDLVIDIIKGFEKILIQKAALGLAGTGISAGEGGIGGLLAAGLGALLAPIGLQTGAWNIPTAQLALLHPGEMVLPSGPAEQYRQGATTTSNTSTNVNMSMSSFDSTGLQAMLNRVMPQLSRSLQSYQQLNPSSQ